MTVRPFHAKSSVFILPRLLDSLRNPWRASALGFPGRFLARQALVPLRSTGAEASSGGNISAGRRASLASLADITRYYGHKTKISEPPLDSPVHLCYYITDAAQRGISMRIFICSSFIYPAFQTEDKRKNGWTEEAHHQNWRVNNQEVPQNVRNHCNRW